MWEIDVIRAWCSTAMYQASQRRRDERGASDLVVIVILVAIVAGGAITVATILVAKAINRANSTPLE